MATLTVTVAGVNRSANLCAPDSGDAATFTEGLRERKRFSCEFESRDGSWFPARGQGITVSHSGIGALFGGYINTATRRKVPGSPAIFTKCTCVSYEQVWDRRRTIARTWTNESVETIFTEIIDESLTDEGFTVEAETGPTIPLFDLQEPRPTVREAVERLCELASNGSDIYYADVSATKVARLFRQNTYTAPFTVTTASPHVLGTSGDFASVDETNQGLVNRVFVYLGQYLLDSAMEAFVGDGAVRTFELDYPVGAVPSISVNGVAVDPADVGVDGADTGKEWYWQIGSNRIRQDDAETELEAADDLEVTYQGLDRRAVGPFDDAVSANFEGVLQGDGTGLYETFLRVDEVSSMTDAETLAQAYLDRYKTATVNFRGSTYTAGLRSGQELTVNLADLGINLTMLVQSVTMTDVGRGNFLCSFTAIHGPARDDWKRGLFGSASVSTSVSGSVGGVGAAGPAGPPGSAATPPGEFTIDSATHRWVTTESGPIVEILIAVTPPGPMGTTEGGHIYLEIEDQSASSPIKLGTWTLGSSESIAGPWDPKDLGRVPYVATEQPWIVRVPGISPRKTTVSRVYVEPYSEHVDAAPIRNGETDETPNATVTITPYVISKPSSAVSATTALITSVVATASAPVTVSGRLLRPISVTVVLPAERPDNWAYQLLGFLDGDITSSPVLATDFLSPDVETDPVPAGEDGIATPHTFGEPEPAEAQRIVIYAVAGLFGGNLPRGVTFEGFSAVFVPNNIVPGITASDEVNIGTTTGVLDLAESILSSVGKGLEKAAGKLLAAIGDGVEFDGSDKITLNLSDGLEFSAGAARVKLGDGTEFNAGAIRVKVGDGIELSGSAVRVKAGDGLELSGGNVKVKLGDGLEIFGSATRIKTGNGIALSGGSVTVNLGNGLTLSGSAVVVNAGGGISTSSGSVAVSTGSGLSIISLQVAIPTNGVVSAMVSSLVVDKLTAGTMISNTTTGIIVKDASSLFQSKMFSGVTTYTYSDGTLSASIGAGLGGFAQVYGTTGTARVALSGNDSGIGVQYGLFVNNIRVVREQQADIGAPSFSVLADAQTYCASLRTVLRTHGLMA